MAICRGRTTAVITIEETMSKIDMTHGVSWRTIITRVSTAKATTSISISISITVSYSVSSQVKLIWDKLGQ